MRHRPRLVAASAQRSSASNNASAKTLEYAFAFFSPAGLAQLVEHPPCKR